MKLRPYLDIIRLQNTVMTAIAVLLGIWISNAHHSLFSIFFLLVAATASIGFGNVINDIVDIETDRISHPERPLPQNEISKRSAIIYALFLCIVSIGCALQVSTQHTIATLLPVILLTIYSLYLKGTPLAGNVIVALLVAYPLIYGGIQGSSFQILLIPATLAFFLNFSREIVKDMQDYQGDQAVGIVTSAILPPVILKSIIITNSIVYTLIIFLPFYLKQFGYIYLAICLIGAIPIHVIRTRILFKTSLTKVPLGKIATLYKIEMFCGLAALLLEKISQFVL